MVGERREPEHTGRGMDAVDDPPVTAVVKIADGGLDVPALPSHAADENPGEAEASRVEPAEPGEPHHVRGGAQHCWCRVHAAHVRERTGKERARDVRRRRALRPVGDGCTAGVSRGASTR